jgi:Kef-type K+ transport system membrane component KefB
VNIFSMNKHKRFVTVLVLSALPAMGLAGEGMHGVGMTSRMMMLAIQLGIILFLAKIGNVAFEKLRMPGVLGELCTGVLIGPFLLGSIPLPAFPNGLFPAATAQFPISPELYGLCSVAAVVLLFMAGLETNIPLFLRYSVAGAMVGVGGVVASFLAGNLLAMALSPWLFGEPLGFFSPACLFLASFPRQPASASPRVCSRSVARWTPPRA